MKIRKRKLGLSGIEISPLVFGGNVFGWTADQPTAFNLLDAFAAAGFNFIDTADMYSTWVAGHKGGESETIIGQWIKQRGNRSRVVVATKVGMEMGPSKKGLSKTYILRAVEDSLRRLQTDYIDLYFSHEDDPNTPMEETLEAYAQLVRQGKVRVIGASNFTAERLEKSLLISKQHGYPSYQCLQPLYNLYDRSEYESTLEPICIKNNLGVISYFSLASGFLTGKYRSEKDLGLSPRGEWVKKYLDKKGLRILSALDQVAKEYRSNPTRVALAWLIARPSITAPIVSATNLKQLQDLLEAPKLQLKTSDISLLNQASK